MLCIKKIDTQFSFDQKRLSELILNSLYPAFELINKLAVHEETKIQLSNINVIASRDTNNGYTFKGEDLRIYFSDWDIILQKVESIIGPAKYKQPHIVVHEGDIRIHMDRRKYSLNIGLLNSDAYQVLVYNLPKTKVYAKMQYKPGEAIILKTHFYHSVEHITDISIRAFLVFTPENDIDHLFV